jgi:hypothetical protein
LQPMRLSSTIVVLLASFLPCPGIEINPPEGWQQQIQTPPTVEKLFALPVEKGEFSPNLAVSRYKLPCCQEGKTSLDSLMRRIKGYQERAFPLYKVTEKGKRKVNGILGAFFLTTYARGDLDAAAFQFFFLEGEEFVNVVYTCLAKDMARLRPHFEKSLATLQASSADSDSVKTGAAKP